MDFGIAQADTQYLAYNGKGPWEGKPVSKLRAVFALAPEAVTFVAAEDSGIKSINDVKGRQLTRGDPGSGNRALTLLTSSNNMPVLFQARTSRDEKA